MHRNIMRLAANEDSAPMLEIYSHYIKNTSITFECEVPSPAEFGERVENISSAYPWLVCEIDDRIAGYAYAAKHHDRAAYQWSVNMSVYIKDEYQRKGIARALYLTLLEFLDLMGYYNAYAGITLPNTGSEGFHQSLGFKPVGIYHNAGYKLGKWHDVIWYELTIKDITKSPSNPLLIKDLDMTKVNKTLQRNMHLIKT